MTSDKTGSTVVPSEAQVQLRYALGKHRVKLDELSQDELTEFLFELLQQVNLKELRGFTPLRDVLSYRGDEPVEVADTCELYRASLFAHSQLDESFSLRTQAIKVCRGVCSQTLTYKRLESGDETIDPNIARGWGKSAYLSAGKACELVLIRLPNPSRADQNLVAIDYRFVKVPNERRFLITSVTATSLSKDSFSSFFGDVAPRTATELLWAIASIYRQTLSDLVAQADEVRRKLNKWDRISDSIG